MVSSPANRAHSPLEHTPREPPRPKGCLSQSDGRGSVVARSSGLRTSDLQTDWEAFSSLGSTANQTLSHPPLKMNSFHMVAGKL